MKFYGKHTQRTAESILDVFQKPETLQRALADVFISRADSDRPMYRWSWRNQLIAVMCGTTDARGFKQWQEVGRNVKKGTKAIWILAPLVGKTKDKDTGEDKPVVYGFRSIPVFKYEDTQGEALIKPESDKYADWISELPLIDVANSWGITVDACTHHQGQALGSYRFGGSGKGIVLATENLSTWAHEMIHASDDKVHGLNKRDRATGEIIAELGSAVLLTCLGFEYEADLGGAYDYIRSWSMRKTGEAVDSVKAKHMTIKRCSEVLKETCECVDAILCEAQRIEVLSEVA